MSDKRKLKILIISSVTYGSGVLGIDIYKAFRSEGYDVDFLTKYKVAGHPEFIDILGKKDGRCSFISQKISGIGRKLHLKKSAKPGYKFYYKKEENPPVDVNKVISKINEKYDFIYVVFWQELLSYATIKAIDEKLGGCKWIFATVDFSTMTGGCHFPQGCKRWQEECGCCPAWNSKDPKDFTNHNLLYRQKVLRHIDVSLKTNSYQRDNFFSVSTLFKNSKFLIGYPLINENDFRPLDMNVVRKDLGLPIDKRIILFGSQSLDNKMKGMDYLMSALHLLYEQSNEQEKDRVLIVSVGRSNDKIHRSIPFEYHDIGYVDIKTLAKLYAASDIFACPSIFDPGPMMVNQAVSCGTPVVAFNQGTILDINRFANCGYTARLKDADDFCYGLKYILSLKEGKYRELRNTCRETALKMTSRHAQVQRIIDYYNIFLR